MHDDEWRLEIELDDEHHGYTLGERLRAHDLDDEARRRLGRRVIVTRDGSRLFLYARTEEQAREAERVIHGLITADELSATITLTRWHQVEQAWKNPSAPLPRTEAEREAERARREAAEAKEAELEGSYDWHVQSNLPHRDDAIELETRLEREGLSVARRWKWVAVGALTEERAEELAARLRKEVPAGSEVWVEANPADLPGPPFVFL